MEDNVSISDVSSLMGDSSVQDEASREGTLGEGPTDENAPVNGDLDNVNVKVELEAKEDGVSPNNSTDGEQLENKERSDNGKDDRKKSADSDGVSEGIAAPVLLHDLSFTSGSDGERQEEAETTAIKQEVPDVDQIGESVVKTEPPEEVYGEQQQPTDIKSELEGAEGDTDKSTILEEEEELSQHVSIGQSTVYPQRLPPLHGKPCLGHHEWPYRKAARVIRNPLIPLCCRPCKDVRAASTSSGLQLLTTRYAGPDRRRGAEERRRIRDNYMNNADVNPFQPNRAVTVPMRPRKWKGMSRLSKQEEPQQWKILEDAEMARKERAMAEALGYQTMLGNILNFDIPGARDLNRSWRHFLDQDPMAWGFPYTKGSRERPCLPLPAPYLVHQLKENFWKYPRNKLIIHNPQDD